MAGEGITFEHEKVKEFFSRISKNVKEIEEKDRVFWVGLQSIAFRDVVDHFEKQQSSTGKWQKWSEIYKKRMIALGKGGNKILQDTGNLRQNIRLADSTNRIKQGQLLFNPAKTKSGEPYAKNHDEGLNGMPQREFMWISDKALNKMSKIMAEYTTKDL